MKFFAYYSTFNAVWIGIKLFCKNLLHLSFVCKLVVYVKKNDGQFSYFIMKTSLFYKRNHTTFFLKNLQF